MNGNDSLIRRLIEERFKATQLKLDNNSAMINILTEKSERSGETDGFRQYLFADLPFAVDGMTEVRFAFVTDGRDVGEGAGNGTGVLCVYKPALDEWRTINGNVAVTI